MLLRQQTWAAVCDSHVEGDYLGGSGAEVDGQVSRRLLVAAHVEAPWPSTGVEMRNHGYAAWKLHSSAREKAHACV